MTPFGMAAAPAVAAPAAATAAAPIGIMSAAGKAVSGAAKWMAANPIPTLLGGQMLSSAFSPNELDVLEQQRQYQLEDQAAANARLEGVGGVPTWDYSGRTVPPVTVPKVQLPAQQIPRPGIMGRRVVLPA